VDEHSDEEHRVEVGNDSGCPDDCTPSETHGPVSNIVGLARVFPPATGKQTVSMSSLNECRVCDRVPRELGEGLTELGDALSLHLEVTLLGHSSVPDKVGGDQSGIDHNVSKGGEAVGRGIMRSHVDDRVNIGERNTSEVPKDDHETPFLVVHVPSLGDTFFTFGASIHIKTGSKAHEKHVGSNVSESIILLASTRNGEIEDNDPRNANLCPHLKVNRTQTGIEGSTHEEIVNHVARHANRSLRQNRMEVGEEGNAETIDHSNAHEMAIVVNDLGEAENTSPVEDKRDNNGRVPTLDAVAVVHEGLVAE